jgi:hypothetical protein
VLMLFLNSWRASVIPYSVTTHPPAIRKLHWHSREAQIEPPLIECECECEWAFRIRAIVYQDTVWWLETRQKSLCYVFVRVHVNLCTVAVTEITVFSSVYWSNRPIGIAEMKCTATMNYI